jgi:hypothetical protein
MFLPVSPSSEFAREIACLIFFPPNSPVIHEFRNYNNVPDLRIQIDKKFDEDN